jgi:ribosomal protein L7/L12
MGMSELLVPVLLVVVVAELLLVMRLTSTHQQQRVLSRLEAKLDALLKHEGVRFDPYRDVPRAVIDALQRGKKVEAIKAYRAATGTDLKEAKEYVDEIARRAAPRM